jgi:RNA polymerase sigma factor for flagellar operon FliA
MTPRKVSTKPIQETWQQFFQKQTEALRNELLVHYWPIVRYTAERLHTKLVDEVEVDDLISAGFWGLKEAIEAFDPDRGVKFETYCIPRIRGAMLDELRKQDWAPRLVRARQTQVDKVVELLTQQLGRRPSVEEIAGEIGLTEADVEKVLRDSENVGMIYLSRKCFETDSNKDIREIDILVDPRQVDPVRDAQRQDIKDLLSKGLNRSERLILILYYFENLTMKEIGIALDLSESRVSQMHSSIINRLRAQYADKADEMGSEFV